MDAPKEFELTSLNLDDIQTWVDGHGDVFTVPNNWSQPDIIISDQTQVTQSAKISLMGQDADIEINGESVVSMLREIRDRLNIIQVSETMEAEWDELRALREQYEAKLAECREKSRAWSALGAQEPKQNTE